MTTVGGVKSYQFTLRLEDPDGDSLPDNDSLYMAIAFGNEKLENVDAHVCASDGSTWTLTDHYGNEGEFEDYFDPAADGTNDLTISADELNHHSSD